MKNSPKEYFEENWTILSSNAFYFLQCTQQEGSSIVKVQYKGKYMLQYSIMQTLK